MALPGNAGNASLIPLIQSPLGSVPVLTGFAVLPGSNSEGNTFTLPDTYTEEHICASANSCDVNTDCGDQVLPNTKPETFRSGDNKSGCCDRCGNWLRFTLQSSIICPTHSPFVSALTIITLLLLLWGVLYSLFKEMAGPNGSLFILGALFLTAHLAGQLISFFRLPHLLGMLITGIVFRNVGYFKMSGVFVDVVSTLRTMAMIVILIKAGLGLDAGALKRLSLVVLRLAFIPCASETIIVAVTSHFLLGFPWLWGLLLGFVLGAVSPAVVVPSLLNLKEKGYGEDKGISTLVIASSSIDDIAAISGFGVVLGIIFSEGEILQQVLQGPIEIAIGLSFGVAWGIVATYLPHKDDPWVVPGRAFMVGGGGLFAVFGTQMAGYDGAGPLASIVVAFVASCGWKMQGWIDSKNQVESVFSSMWQVFQPILFGLIGTEIDLFQLDGHTIGLGLAILVTGLVIRCTVCLGVTLGGTLNPKEMLFVAIAWLPKATVQAALGPVALDIARKKQVSENLAEQVLTIAVLSILITAPLGAVGIMLSGPKLLNKSSPKKNVDHDDLVDCEAHENA